MRPLLLCLLLTACAQPGPKPADSSADLQRSAEQAQDQGDWLAAAGAWGQLLRLDPAHPRARQALQQIERDAQLQQALAELQRLLDLGELAAAQQTLQRLLERQPEAAQRTDLRALRQRLQMAEQAAAPSPEPQLRGLDQPVSLRFKDTALRMVFALLSENTGLNFLFDRDVAQDQSVTLFLQQTPLRDALRLLLQTNQLEHRVLNANSLLIYPASEDKRALYQELQTRHVYLAHAAVKEVAALLKTMVKSLVVHADERNNALVLRDAPDALRYAERLIAAHDLPMPEVMLAVEVLEVSSGLLEEVGLRWPTSIGATLQGAQGAPGQLSLAEWRQRDAGLVRLAVGNPTLLLNLREDKTRTRLLANPRIRVKSREKARVHIGDKVPLVSSTLSNNAVSETISYLDVGLKLDVEPQVKLFGEVDIKVGLEVSNVVEKTTTANGTLAYRLGTRNANAVLQLRDGETQVLAGLISDEDRRGLAAVPGMSRLPVLGSAFSSRKDESSRTEVVLLITPHIVRNLTPPAGALSRYPSGPAASPGAAPLQLPTPP